MPLLTVAKHRPLWFLLAVALFLSAPPIPSVARDTQAGLTVYVVNYPLQYFAERIAGKHATVIFPAPEDEDPAFWMPVPATITAYQQADLVLLNGATYAKWVDKVSLPRSRVVNTSAGFSDRYIQLAAGVTHSHGPEGAHAHQGPAFTTWLDFALAAQQAKAIAEALGRKRPELQETFQNNLLSLEQDLLALDQQLRELIAQHPQLRFVASHPVYQYLARRYGLQLKSVQWEPQEMPSKEQWAELTSMLKDHPAQWMMWEDEPQAEVVARLESMGIRSLVFRTAAKRPASGDFLTVMQQNINNLRSAFSTQRLDDGAATR